MKVVGPGIGKKATAIKSNWKLKKTSWYK